MYTYPGVCGVYQRQENRANGILMLLPPNRKLFSSIILRQKLKHFPLNKEQSILLLEHLENQQQSSICQRITFSLNFSVGQGEHKVTFGFPLFLILHTSDSEVSGDLCTHKSNYAKGSIVLQPINQVLDSPSLLSSSTNSTNFL